MEHRPPTVRADAATVVLMASGGLSDFFVADENRRFLGELSPGKWFESSLTPGKHVLYIFHGTEMHEKKSDVPDNIGIRCIRADLLAGKTYYLNWRFLSPAHGTTGEKAEFALMLAEDGLDPATPVPESETMWHLRVKRKREQLKMDPWGYLKARARTEPLFEQGQKEIDTLFAQAKLEIDPATNLPKRCRPPETDDTIAAQDFIQ